MKNSSFSLILLEVSMFISTLQEFILKSQVKKLLFNNEISVSHTKDLQVISNWQSNIYSKYFARNLEPCVNPSILPFIGKTGHKSYINLIFSSSLLLYLHDYLGSFSSYWSHWWPEMSSQTSSQDQVLYLKGINSATKTHGHYSAIFFPGKLLDLLKSPPPLSSVVALTFSPVSLSLVLLSFQSVSIL